MNNLSVKFESDRATAVVYVFTYMKRYTDSFAHQTTHEQQHYYIPSNNVAKG